MRKILTVAAREFIETVKTKTFFISSVLIPALMIVIILASQRITEMSEQQEIPTRHIDIVDQTDGAFAHLEQLVEQYNREHPQRKFAVHRVAGDDAAPEQLRQRVLDGETYAYLVIPAAILTVPPPPTDSQPAGVGVGLSARERAERLLLPAKSDAVACEFGLKDSKLEAQMAIQGMVEQAVTALRFERADPPIDLERVNRLQKPIAFRQVDVKSGQETTGSEFTRFLTPFAFMFLLFMGIMTISQGLLTSVIEEKSSRVIEVLLSAVSPTQLMAGKMLGMVAVGASLMAIWATVGYGGAHLRGMGYLVTPYRLTYGVLYFIPGFLLFAGFLAAIGAACNTLKEAQSMAAPLTLLTILPMMLWWAISQNPTSIFSVVLSYIPPITPFVMILRLCADPETRMVEIVLTLVILWVSVVFTVWAAGKIFRVGVLMYGKPPSPRELIHWLRYA